MTMGPGLKKFLKKHGRFPKGPKERREAGTMTKKDKARARNKSGSTKKKKSSTKKKSTKSKSKKSTKSKSKSNGGKKMKSRLSPFNKNGVKIVTLAGLIGFLGPLFDSRSRDGVSPLKKMTSGKFGEGLDDYGTMLLSPHRPYKKLLVGGGVVAAGSRITDVRSISFVQFS